MSSTQDLDASAQTRQSMAGAIAGMRGTDWISTAGIWLKTLQTHMVFSSCSSPTEEDAVQSEVEDELYSGLRTQDLQEAKDQLLVETADMLHTPLFTAEALLRDNEWSREVQRQQYSKSFSMNFIFQSLLDKWMSNPVDCCVR